MVNRGEEKVWVQMNVVPRSTGNTNSVTRELTLKCKLKCYFKPMNNPLGVSPSKGKQGTTRGKEKNLLTSVGIEPTTYGLDLPSLCRLSYKVALIYRVNSRGRLFRWFAAKSYVWHNMNVVPRTSTSNTNSVPS